MKNTKSRYYKATNPIIANADGESEAAEIITAGGNTLASLLSLLITGQTPTTNTTTNQELTLQKSKSNTIWIVGGVAIIAVIIAITIYLKKKK